MLRISSVFEARTTAMLKVASTATMLAVWLAAGSLPIVADDGRGGEVGFVVGAFSADDEMTGDSGATELSLGLRGGAVFTRHIGWFVDGLYTNVATDNGLGDARTVIGRTGIDWLFSPQREARWFVSAGFGWMVVDYEDASYEDFHNPLAALGFGQRIRVGDNLRLRWELRGDRLLDDARLEDELVQAHALLGLTWGPGGAVGGQPQVSRGDEDGDGVHNRRDLCPATPSGAEVDSHGCPFDEDRDGVPNSMDRCPRTRSGESVGPDGCAADADGDGVPNRTDACPATPPEVEVDEWGCPKDADGDGVVDGLDRCPNTSFGAEVDDSGCATDADGDGDGAPDSRDARPDTPPQTRVDDVKKLD